MYPNRDTKAFFLYTFNPQKAAVTIGNPARDLALSSKHTHNSNSLAISALERITITISLGVRASGVKNEAAQVSWSRDKTKKMFGFQDDS